MVIEQYQVQCELMSFEDVAANGHMYRPTFEMLKAPNEQREQDPGQKQRNKVAEAAPPVAQAPAPAPQQEMGPAQVAWLDEQLVTLAMRTRKPLGQCFLKKLRHVFPAIQRSVFVERIKALIAAGRIGEDGNPPRVEKGQEVQGQVHQEMGGAGAQDAVETQGSVVPQEAPQEAPQIQQGIVGTLPSQQAPQLQHTFARPAPVAALQQLQSPLPSQQSQGQPLQSALPSQPLQSALPSQPLQSALPTQPLQSAVPSQALQSALPQPAHSSSFSQPLQSALPSQEPQPQTPQPEPPQGPSQGPPH